MIPIEYGEGTGPIEPSFLSEPLRQIVTDIRIAWEDAKTPSERISLKYHAGVCIQLQPAQEATMIELPRLDCYSRYTYTKKFRSMARRNTGFQRHLAQSLGILGSTETWPDFLKQRVIIMTYWDKLQYIREKNPNTIIGIAADSLRGDPDYVTNVLTKYEGVLASIEFKQSGDTGSVLPQLANPLLWYMETGWATPIIWLRVPAN